MVDPCIINLLFSLAWYPLVDMLNRLADETQSSGLGIQMNIHKAARELSIQAELTLYRAVQESLTNIWINPT